MYQDGVCGLICHRLRQVGVFPPLTSPRGHPFRSKSNYGNLIEYCCAIIVLVSFKVMLT